MSSDLLTWTVLPDALGPGDLGAFDDVATWTGCVVPRGDDWSMFYTGLSAGHAQRIGLADSSDLITWRKHRDNPILVSDARRYEPAAGDGGSLATWRDPWVYRRGRQHHMLITARAADGPSRSRGSSDGPARTI